MEIERRTAQNTAIILIDYIVGFANLFHSQPLAENINGALALEKLAVGWQIPLILTAGPQNDLRGPLYPQLEQLVRPEQIVRKGGQFDAFDFEPFATAVTATGVKHLLIAGIMTEGCVLQTTLGALRRGFTVSLCVDATAGATTLTHDAALRRMEQLGVVPTTWESFAGEVLRTYEDEAKVGVFRKVRAEHSPSMSMNMLTTLAIQKAVKS